MAFLDVVTCGFGAIVLLLLITRPQPEPAAGPEETVTPALIEATASFVGSLRAQAGELRRTLAELAAAAATPRPSRTGADPGRLEAASKELEEIRKSNEGLVLVKESLSRASIRAAAAVEERDPEVGGIPVDSEYVVFILDTSGSMKNIDCQVQETFQSVLDIHPTVKGFQVMDADGRHLFGGTEGRWLGDSPSKRVEVRLGMRGMGGSSSSPVRGLETAIRTYAKDGGKKVAIYVFGDDFSGGSAQEFVNTLDTLNVDSGSGKRKARVHAIGFGINHRYATLMRAVTNRNDGAFIALPPGC